MILLRPSSPTAETTDSKSVKYWCKSNLGYFSFKGNKMKLFYYNEKDQQIIDNLDLGELSPKEENLINKVIDFLNKTSIIDQRYKCLELCEGANYAIDENSESYIDFEVK